MTRRCLLLLGLLAVAAPAAAQAPTKVSGTFTSKDVSFRVAGAVAFNGKSHMNGTTPVVLVAISNTGLNADAVADFVDRKRAIEKLIKDDETPVVYLEFTPQGQWRGVSYYLASGNGCGFCSGEVTGTGKIVAGRLTASLKNRESDRSFDVTLDVPVLSDDHGAALPADGGAPGKAYLAYHAAVLKRDAAAIDTLLSPGNREMFAKAKKDGDTDGYLSYLIEKHSMRSVKITAGWATADKASLLVTGDSSVGTMSGEVFLLKTKGAWGIDEELIDLK
jgi:hypothetical protein